jgi:hypothetical protein
MTSFTADEGELAETDAAAAHDAVATHQVAVVLRDSRDHPPRGGLLRADAER